MKLTVDDIKNNLDFCDGEISQEAVLNFLDNNIDYINFSCIDDDAEWEVCKLKEFEELEDKDYVEKHYIGLINVDDEGNLTLEDFDNTQVEIGFAYYKDRKISWIQYFV